ncbi:TolC family protein [Aestuariibaculum sediminum]|uniref:TolC family protein n=1 Tax=Aestuariibaculum sediminum TaxID=2770637 RepID=A0A8J6U9P4_9FLAO|nr:TolC family protein [Aestuariibaculum sediminum]MBD0833462.1 TolC family protein [Aestuariibaculum sediminum]
MLKLKYNILLLMFLMSVVSVAQQKKWSLQECIDYALENNISVQKSQNSLLTGEQNVIAAKGGLLPSIGASANQSMGFGNQELFQGQFVNRTSHQTNFGIQVSQTVFNGFRNSNLYKQSRLSQEANELQLQQLKDDIALNVANAYLNVLFNKENLEIAKAQIEFSKNQLEQVKSFVNAGVQPKANIFDAEATLASDEQSLINAENSYNLSLLSLSQLLQIPNKGFQIELIDINSFSFALFYNDVDSILSYAYDNRNEIKLAKKNVEVAELGTEVNKAGYWPTVSFGYGFGSNVFFSNLTENEDSFFNQLNNQKSHSFRLGVNIPIFSKYQNKTAVAKSQIQEQNSKLDLQQAKLDLENNIQQAFTDAQAALKAFEAAKKSIESQKIAFENAEERYKLGNMTAFDLEQTRIRYLNAQTSLINSKYDFVFKTKVLDFYMGKSLKN